MKEYKWIDWKGRNGFSFDDRMVEYREMLKEHWKMYKLVWIGEGHENLKGIVYFKKIPWYKAIALFFKGKK